MNRKTVSRIGGSLTFLLILSSTGCTRPVFDILRPQRVVASYYGPGFHGRTTANGERFDANALTAAHRTLPFGTRVKVTNPATGRSVVVRINDRGPFRRGREIDLSARAARMLGLYRRGIGEVILEVLDGPGHRA
jgi:rare lipoprotein A